MELSVKSGRQITNKISQMVHEKNKAKRTQGRVGILTSVTRTVLTGKRKEE